MKNTGLFVKYSIVDKILFEGNTFVNPCFEQHSSIYKFLVPVLSQNSGCGLINLEDRVITIRKTTVLGELG